MAVSELNEKLYTTLSSRWIIEKECWLSGVGYKSEDVKRILVKKNPYSFQGT